MYKSGWHSYEDEPLSEKDRSRLSMNKGKGSKKHKHTEEWRDRSPTIEEVLEGQTGTVTEWAENE